MESTTHSWHGRGGATLKDIARSVGVSESVASVVLNGSKSHTRVSAGTRERVNLAAQKLGYRPNAQAQALFSGRTGRIGIYANHLVDNAADPFWSAIQAGLFRGAHDHDVDIVIHTSVGKVQRMVEMVSNRAIDGLIITNTRPNDPILALLEERRVPAVAIVDHTATVPSVCVDERRGGALLAQHLWARGHRHVLVVTRNSDCGPSPICREDGFCDAATLLGMRVTVDKSGSGVDSPLTVRQLDAITIGQGRATAIMARNDGAAEIICDQLFALGIDIPSQVAVVGFDGHDPYFTPRLSLTSIRANWSNVAHKSVDILMRLVNGNPVELLTVLPVEFKQGAST